MEFYLEKWKWKSSTEVCFNAYLMKLKNETGLSFGVLVWTKFRILWCNIFDIWIIESYFLLKNIKTFLGGPLDSSPVYHSAEVLSSARSLLVKETWMIPAVPSITFISLVKSQRISYSSAFCLVFETGSCSIAQADFQLFGSRDLLVSGTTRATTKPASESLFNQI